MKRSRIRKLVKLVPTGLPAPMLREALNGVSNPEARRQLRARVARRDAR